MVLAVICRQAIILYVSGKLSLGDAIRIPTDDRTHVWPVVLQVAIEIVVTEHDIIELAIPVGHLERNYNAAVGCDLRFRSAGIREREEIDRGPFIRLSKRLLVN